MADELVSIEVAFATPGKQQVIQLEVPAGTLIMDAVRQSGIESYFPDIDLSELPLGVWNEVKPQTYEVKAGDRVEVYRQLVTSAKEARRRRAESQAIKKT